MPTNEVMGEVAVDIGGQARVLEFNFETFEQIGQQLDLPEFGEVVQKMVADFQGKIASRTFWIVLTEALREHWPEVTATELRRNLKPRDMERVAKAVVAAIDAAMPEPPPPEQPAGKKRPDPGQRGAS